MHSDPQDAPAGARGQHRSLGAVRGRLVPGQLVTCDRQLRQLQEIENALPRDRPSVAVRSDGRRARVRIGDAAHRALDRLSPEDVEQFIQGLQDDKQTEPEPTEPAWYWRARALTAEATLARQRATLRAEILAEAQAAEAIARGLVAILAHATTDTERRFALLDPLDQPEAVRAPEPRVVVPTGSRPAGAVPVEVAPVEQHATSAPVERFALLELD